MKVKQFAGSLCAAVGVLFGGTAVAAPDVSLVTVDSVGETGLDSSLVLDAAGNPVTAYRDVTNGDLRLVHCDDPVCASVETPVAVDAAGDTGRNPSLVLDVAGNPVIAYFELTGSEIEGTIGSVRLVHCDDPNCAGVETPVTVDPTGPLGSDACLVLDAAGNPVIAWSGLGARGLRLVHCDDPACAGVETPVVVDPNGRDDPSLVLDAAGNPVIAYRGGSSRQAELWVTRCADPACAATASSVGPTGVAASTARCASPQSILPTAKSGGALGLS